MGQGLRRPRGPLQMSGSGFAPYILSRLKNQSVHNALTITDGLSALGFRFWPSCNSVASGSNRSSASTDVWNAGRPQIMRGCHHGARYYERPRLSEIYWPLLNCQLLEVTLAIVSRSYTLKLYCNSTISNTLSWPRQHRTRETVPIPRCLSRCFVGSIPWLYKGRIYECGGPHHP